MSKKRGKAKSLAKKRRKERRLAQKQLLGKPEQEISVPTSSLQTVEVAQGQPTGRPEQAIRLMIQPSDVWLFRDGKPFRAGEDHWATSRFPPTPLTMQGVIRSKILLHSQTDLAGYANNPEAYSISREIGGKGQDYGTLKLRGPYLARKNGGEWQRYYPLPADVVKDKEKDEYHRLVLKKERLIANWPVDHPYYLALPIRKAEPAFGWISTADLQAYLIKGAAPEWEAVLRGEQIYRVENRFNFKVDRAPYRPERQYLTETGLIRLCPDIALEVEVEGVSAWQPQEGYLGIGGEARTGYYQIVNPAEPAIPGSNPLPSQFVLYFVTPAWFKNGWQPEDWSQWFGGVSVRLVAAAVNRAERIGGWDIAQGEKPMKAYVPAGSVYYFECNGEVTYNGQPITDDLTEGQIGFGQVLIGQWQNI